MRPVQLIDARDLAAWLVRQAEASGTVGPFNLTGPTIAFSEVLGAIAGGGGRFAHLHLGERRVPVLAWRRPGRATVLGARGRGGVLAGRDREGTRPWSGVPSCSWRRRATLSRGCARVPPTPGQRSRLVRAGLSPEREAELLAELRRGT